MESKFSGGLLGLIGVTLAEPKKEDTEWCLFSLPSIPLIKPTSLR